MNTKLYLENKIKNAESIDFGLVLDETFKLFKKVWLNGFLLILIVGVVSAGLNFMLQIFGVIVSPDGSQFRSIEGFLNYYSQNVYYAIPQAVITTFLSLTLLAGFFKSCKNSVAKEANANDLFYYFKPEYLGKIALLALLNTIIATVAQVMFVIPYIYAFVPLSFVSVIFAFNPHLSVGEILELSFSIGTRKWFVTFGLLFVTGLIGALGVIACFIGVLFTMSIVYLPIFLIYKEVVGFEEKSELDEIGNNYNRM